MARLALLFLLVTLVGCTEREAANPALRDDLGRAVAVDLPAERVLTLAPNLTEILYAVGGGPKLVGASQADNFPSEAAALPRFGTYPLDVEAIVSLRPDLVIGTDQVNNPADAVPLADAGIPAYYLSFDAVDDVPRAMRTIGALVGTETQAEAAADAFTARMEQIKQQTEGRDRPRTLLLIGDETLFAFGSGSYTQELIEIAGGESVTNHFDGEAITLSEEFVLEAAPDVIVGAFGPDYDAAKLSNLHPAWGSVPAVAAGRVYGIDPDLLLRPGPRLAEGAETLARLLHPAAFTGEVSGPDTEDP